MKAFFRGFLLLALLTLCCRANAATAVSEICAVASWSTTGSCNATGTPAVSATAVLIFISSASVAPSSSNISCTDGQSNSYTFRGGTTATTSNAISVVDATLSSVASNMSFSCTTTQTGAYAATNLHAVLVTGSNGTIDVGPLFTSPNPDGTSWTTPTLTPNVAGDAMVSAFDEASSQEGTITVSGTWTGGTEEDSFDAGVGPSEEAWLAPYNSVSSLSNTFTCTASCTSSGNTAATMIVAYSPPGAAAQGHFWIR